MFIATLTVVIANRKKRHTTDSFFLFRVRVAKIWKGVGGGGIFKIKFEFCPVVNHWSR